MKKRMRNKRGWIRIFEAVIALLLIIGVVLTLASKGYLFKEDISETIYELQIGVLREIEKDPYLRQQILVEPVVPISVKSRILERMPEHLECDSKTCAIDEICSLDSYLDQDVYAQSVAIAATVVTYDPKQLRMFCWVK